MASAPPSNGRDMTMNLDVSAAAADIARKHFGIEPVDALDPLPGHGHVFLVHSSGSRFVLKCTLDSAQRTERLKTVHEFVRILNEFGFLTYSLIHTANGGTWVCGGGLIWEMHTYIAGQPLRSLALDPSGVGRLLGDYHRAAVRIVRSRISASDSCGASGLESADPKLVLKALSSRLRDAGVLTEVNRLVDLSRSLSQGLGAEDPVIPLHGDISASNIIVCASRYFLIDFEDLAWGDPGIDTAQALARLVAGCQQRPRASTRSVILEFLSSYASSVGSAVQPSARLSAVAKLHAIKDWACDQLSASLPDQTVAETLPSLCCTLDLLSRFAV
jgi:Ser/Thr protein kinase RdoA (MazF antagonist)